MAEDTRFDDIRPYRDEEVPAAMQRIVSNQAFPLIASFVFPDITVKEAAECLLAVKNTFDFQHDVMFWFCQQVIGRSITELTSEGAEKLDSEKRYLFVSNHRDIVLDSCLQQLVLHRFGHDTAEITFGANLMQGQLMIDIGKSNKMFRVERGGNPREFYNSSMHLSEYMRYALLEKHQSVWIAQRNGRTKDGIDRTDQGVVKMFGMSRTDDRVASLSELNIVPVAVSYEWEPCDILKTLELYATRNGEKYIKKPGEDLNSILTGIMEFKGRMHYTFGDVISQDDLEAMRDLPNVQFHRSVAALMDKRICSGYRLWPNNYIAHDLRYGKTEYRDMYTDAQLEAFLKHMGPLSKYEDADPDVLKDIFLGIYANPLEPLV